MTYQNGTIIDGTVFDGPPAQSLSLEEKVDALLWLHAELSYNLRLAAVTQRVQELGPEIQQALVEQLMAQQ